jgi:hypothetical protein
MAGCLLAGALALTVSPLASAVSVTLDFNLPTTNIDGAGTTCRSPARDDLALPICAQWLNFDYNGFRFSPISLWQIEDPANRPDVSPVDFNGSNYFYWGDTGGHNPGYIGPDPGAGFPLYVDHYGDPFTLESLWLVYNCSTFVTSSAGGDSRSNTSAHCPDGNPFPSFGGLQTGLNTFTGPEWTDITYLVIWGSSPAIGQGIDNLTLNGPPAKIAEPSPMWLLTAMVPLWWGFRRRTQSRAAIKRST